MSEGKYPAADKVMAGDADLTAYKDRECLVETPGRAFAVEGRWWSGPMAGYVQTRDEAGVWPVGEWREWCQHEREAHILHILPINWNGEHPKDGESDLRYLLGRRLADGLADYPQNAVFRSLVLARLKKPIPDEVKTYEEIEKWAKENINPKDVVRHKPGEAAFVMRCGASDIAQGTCRFSVPRHAEKEYTFYATEVLEIARDSVNFDELVENVRELGFSKVQNDRPNFEEPGPDDEDMQFTRFEVNDTEESNEHVNYHTTWKEVEIWLQANHPDLLKSLMDAREPEDVDGGEPEPDEERQP